MGGTRISTALGAPYLAYLIDDFERAGNRTDYISYFFQRSSQILGVNGALGMVAPNSIAETDTRHASLELLIDQGFTIFRADPERPWEGAANVTVSPVHIRRSGWSGTFYISNAEAAGISAYLSEPNVTTMIGEPHELDQKIAVCGLGSKPNGTGFILEPEEALAMLHRCPDYAEVVKPYLNAEDIASSTAAYPSRYAIYFGEYSENECQSRWPLAFSVVTKRVKPRRIADTDRVRREKWWQFERHAKDVYESLVGLDRCIVVPETSKFLIFSWQSVGIIFSNLLNVVGTSDDRVYCLLQSTIHEVFARRPGQSRLENRPRYNAAKCFRTFPPPTLTDDMSTAGRAYDNHRNQIGISRDFGLTEIYNRVHDPNEHAEDIQRLRDLRVEMDNAVADAYGWSELRLEHGFHQTAQGLRFTISEEARREVLGRLLALNHERYAEEVAAGLHDGSKGKGKSAARNEGTESSKPARRGRPPSSQAALL